jgi:hypothetical protein
MSECKKVYAIMHRGYECDDLDYGGFDIVFLSLDKAKRDEVFERLRQKKMHPAADSHFFKDFEAGEDKPDYFEYYYGKWCYEYKVSEFDLEDETKIW